MGDAGAGRHGGLAQYHFHRANQLKSETNVDYVLDNITGITLAVMPKAGKVVGLAVQGSDVVTAGSGVWSVQESGTELTETEAPQVTLDTTTTNNGYDTARPNAVRFAAGALLGVSVTTNGTFAPETIEYIASLFVQWDPE